MSMIKFACYDEFEVNFFERFDNKTLNIAIFRKRQPLNRYVVVNIFTGEEKTLGECEEVPKEYLITLGRALAGDFIKGFRKFLDDNQIVTVSEDKMAGQLEAIKYHLEDMRKLVFGEVK